jgi:hypothetical protein
LNEIFFKYQIMSGICVSHETFADSCMSA